MAEATGAFIVCAALIIAGRRDRLVRARDGQIPMPLAGALLAGVLARFGLDAFVAAADRRSPLVLRCSPPTCSAGACWPRYAVAGVLAGRHRDRRGDAADSQLGGVQWALTRAGVHRARVQLARRR